MGGGKAPPTKPAKPFQLISAGPPCEEYSITKTVGRRDVGKADKLVRKTLEIIKYFQPQLWCLENPRGGHLK
jgi:site-specific DNA-cytosine methylase